MFDTSDSPQIVRKRERPPKHFVVVLGPSRSGTTLLAATLHAHPCIQISFEPGPRSPEKNPPVFTTIKWFESYCAGRQPHFKRDRTVLGFKETLGRWETFSWVTDCLQHFAINDPGIPITCIVIVRDPFEAYLSQGDGARKWWGNPNWSPNPQGAAENAYHTAKGIVALHGLASQYGGLVLSYKSLVTHPQKVIERVTNRIGLAVCSEQLDYHNNGPMPGVNGDVDVAQDPKPISAERYTKRRAEALRFRESCGQVSNSQTYRALAVLIDFLDEEVIADVSNSRLCSAIGAIHDVLAVAKE